MMLVSVAAVCAVVAVAVVDNTLAARSKSVRRLPLGVWKIVVPTHGFAPGFFLAILSGNHKKIPASKAKYQDLLMRQHSAAREMSDLILKKNGGKKKERRKKN